MPDLLFFNQMSFGGWGRLVYSESAGRYELLDGRVHTYVVDGQRIRLMRPDEGGGMMGNPATVVALDGKVFGNSAYAEVLELDPVTGEPGEKFSTGPFAYGGSGSTAVLFASSKALLVFSGMKLTALDSRLRKLGEKTLELPAGHVRLSPEFVQAGEELHGIVVDNPNTYTDCIGNCNRPTVISHAIVDFSIPADLKVTTHEEEIKEQAYFAHKALDAAHEGWLLAKSSFGKGPVTLEFRAFSHLAAASARLALPEGVSIAAATKTAPLWLVLEKQGEPAQLARVDWDGKALHLSTFPLDGAKGSWRASSLVADGSGRLFLAALHRLSVYDASGPAPRLLLNQEFLDATRSPQLQLVDLRPVSLSAAPLVLDRSRLESTLAKEFWNERDQLTLAAEIDKLKPTDTWAIALFTNLLGRRQASYHGGIAYAARALAKFGPAAASAVPSLIYSTLEGSSIRGDALPLVVEAVRKIDPQGNATRAMLPACIKKTYVCDHVGKKILEALPGQ